MTVAASVLIHPRAVKFCLCLTPNQMVGLVDILESPAHPPSPNGADFLPLLAAYMHPHPVNTTLRWPPKCCNSALRFSTHP